MNLKDKHKQIENLFKSIFANLPFVKISVVQFDQPRSGSCTIKDDFLVVCLIPWFWGLSVPMKMRKTQEKKYVRSAFGLECLFLHLIHLQGNSIPAPSHFVDRVSWRNSPFAKMCVGRGKCISLYMVFIFSQEVQKTTKY